MASSFRNAACAASSASRFLSMKSSSTKAVSPTKERVSFAQTRSVCRLTASSIIAFARRTFLGAVPSPPPPARARRRRTSVSSRSSVSCGQSWNLWASTSFRRTWASSMELRSANSKRAKTAVPIEGLSTKHFWSSPRFPATATARRCGHSVRPERLSSCLARACKASSPKRSVRSGSFSVSASFTRRIPPSAALTTFFIFVSMSPPPLQPARMSLRVTSTTWPVPSTPSFSSMPPRRRATVLVQEPGPPWRKAK
mmetsp:Transcript_85202/g.182612  ORF Transcript_85202/g.182612 Transcript_85202/m.182612 type:complete len:255 (-) Transcript_85202:1053-1817(-)